MWLVLHQAVGVVGAASESYWDRCRPNVKPNVVGAAPYNYCALVLSHGC